MADTEEPLFDPSLKKRKPKKKAVAFNEELEDDAAAGAPPPSDALGNTPASEPMPAAVAAPSPGPSILKQPPINGVNGAAGDVEGITKAVDDFGFGDLKKKKKKKEIPLDFVSSKP